MHSEEVKTVSKGALSFFSGTFLSRITGMLRDVSMAFCFGSHPAIAAFMVSYRLANLFRRVVGEGPVPSGFIPHFESLRKESPKKGAYFFRDVFFSLLLFLVGLVLVLSTILWSFMQYGSLGSSTKEILSLTLLMMPGLLFICLYAMSSALLQCEKKFFLPGIAPVLFNAAWIGAVVLFRNSLPEVAVLGLSWAVVIGFFLQWALLLPSMKHYFQGLLSWKELFQFHLFSSEVKAIWKPVFLGIIGVSATQVNSALDAIFARSSSLEGPAYLWYAIRIEQLPLALFGIALSSALLPPLARAFSKQNFSECQGLLHFSFVRSFHLIFPCLIGLFVLAASGVNLLYGRGDFSQEATAQTIFCLWGYGAGLLPSVFVLLLAPAFYSQKEFRVPMKAALYSVALNVFLNAFFVFALHLGAVSIAFSTSISAWFNFFFLSRALKEKGIFGKNRDLLKGCYGVTFCTLIAGFVTFCLGYFLVGDPTLSLFLGKGFLAFSRNAMDQIMHFFVLFGVFFLTMISYAWLLDVKGVLSLLGISRKRESVKNP